MKSLARHLVFPLTMLIGVSLLLAASARGADPEVLFAITFFGMIAWIAFLERVLPYRADWNESHGDLKTDILFLPTTLVVSAVAQTGGALVAVWAGAALSSQLGIGLWPTHWPLIAQVLLACAVAELPNYWSHRALHEIPFLWRFHRVHHSAPRLYWLNATRMHPFDMLLRVFLGAIPLALLGVGSEVLTIWALVIGVSDFFQHGNVDIDIGPWGWIFSIGALHRWHHSVIPAEADRNFGSSFMIWDIVFGTRYLPSGSGGPEVLGIDDPLDFPTSYWQQIRSPFRT